MGMDILDDIVAGTHQWPMFREKKQGILIIIWEVEWLKASRAMLDDDKH